MKTVTGSVTILFSHQPNILSLVPMVTEGEVYFSEHDGVSLNSLDSLLSILPKDSKLEGNSKTESWVSCWNDDALQAFDGRRVKVEVTQVYDEDNDELTETNRIVE
jgi:hypothetical protein